VQQLLGRYIDPADEANQPSDEYWRLELYLSFSWLEDEQVWLKRVFDAAQAAVEEFDGRPFVHVDHESLPPRTDDCADGCGAQHAVRNLWSIHPDAQQHLTLTDDAPVLDEVVVHVDTSLPNLHALHAHSRALQNLEAEKPAPDIGSIFRHGRHQDQLAEVMLATRPEQAAVAEPIQEWHRKEYGVGKDR
jgi:hypothetical protein